MVVIIDYGMGNVGSVKNAFDFLGEEAIISRKEEDIKSASHIVLPGVGAFKKGMENLVSFGLLDILHHEVLDKKKPFLGLCLGMQLLADEGEEGGTTKGLGWVAGKVRKFSTDESKFKIPHVGWNDVSPQNNSKLFMNISNPVFYFVHSFHFVPDDVSVVAAKTNYGENFVSAVEKENIFGLQFHPEKSQSAGLEIFTNFLKVK